MKTYGLVLLSEVSQYILYEERKLSKYIFEVKQCRID